MRGLVVPQDRKLLPVTPAPPPHTIDHPRIATIARTSPARLLDIRALCSRRTQDSPTPLTGQCRPRRHLPSVSVRMGINMTALSRVERRERPIARRYSTAAGPTLCVARPFLRLFYNGYCAVQKRQPSFNILAKEAEPKRLQMETLGASLFERIAIGLGWRMVSISERPLGCTILPPHMRDAEDLPTKQVA
jgi:hypothetical protein